VQRSKGDLRLCLDPRRFENTVTRPVRYRDSGGKKGGFPNPGISQQKYAVVWSSSGDHCLEELQLAFAP
jgi:hypothetical protein